MVPLKALENQRFSNAFRGAKREQYLSRCFADYPFIQKCLKKFFFGWNLSTVSWLQDWFFSLSYPMLISWRKSIFLKDRLHIYQNVVSGWTKHLKKYFYSWIYRFNIFSEIYKNLLLRNFSTWVTFLRMVKQLPKKFHRITALSFFPGKQF